jgi:hypothetical protein
MSRRRPRGPRAGARRGSACVTDAGSACRCQARVLGWNGAWLVLHRPSWGGGYPVTPQRLEPPRPMSEGDGRLTGMPKLSEFDRAGLASILREQHSVIDYHQASGCKMSEKAIRYRTRPGGPWQMVLPGVYVTHSGALTTSQKAMAAWRYAGTAIAITGQAAVACYGIPAKPTEFVDVLVPLTCRRKDAGFARLHRTSVMPELGAWVGPVTYACPAHAVADTVRQLGDLSDVRALVAAGVQRGVVELWQLERCIAAGPVRGSARLRQALAEVADGVRSAAEGDLRMLIRRAHLPAPLFNPRLLVGTEFLASPDAWWPEYGVAAEVDSRAWHLSPADWEKTMARHAHMTAQGILVLHFPPRRLRTDERAVANDIRSAIASSGGKLPHIVTSLAR